ncbi:ABC transporter substrate-binding protein [Ornithinimicrobium murale]|uniref:ABC transporter substrate-binding protein n=1 Tax=Ornithinimicrobium murale TaxID=1050153 RepID=UPI000E0E0255|nr:iron-siderophore ABC transporter substrate-binding protein [Ornithinimicrobium murale]
MPLPRHALITSTLLVSALALTACGTTEEPDPGGDPQTSEASADAPAGGQSEDSADTGGSATEAPGAGSATDDDAAGASEGPVTYTDERGEHTLEEPADEVVSLEWGLTENLLALGIEPVGQADIEGYNTWDTVAPLDPEGIVDVGTRGEPSLSDITALEPDLIVTTTDLPDNVIGQLEDIAPVLTVRGSDSADPLAYMRSTVELLGTATGTEDKAEQALAQFDETVAEGQAAIEDAGLAGEEFVMADGWLNNGVVSVRMFTPGSYFGALGEELGLVNAWTEGGDPDYGLAQTDVEGLTALDELHFIYAANDSEADPFADGLADNPIWQQLPFVTADQVHRIPDGIWMFGGPLSGEAFIDATVDALTSEG